ncbi:MAG: Flp pilus assembly protein CpaB [Candidatus Velamenicoccus archaeovorus]
MLRRRWSLASKALALLAIAAGGAAFLLVRGYAARLEALRPVTGDVVRVLVAAHELPRGTVLGEGDLTSRDLPSAYAPPGAIRSAGDAEGRVLAAPLGAGEPLTRTRLAAAGAGPVAALVPSGLRAFPVAVDIPPGAVRAGDLVDLLATFGGPHPYTDTVAQGLEVLRVIDARQGSSGALGSVGGTGTATLILLVEPDQAERVAFAVAFGTLSVTVAPPPSAFPG